MRIKDPGTVYVHCKSWNLEEVISINISVEYIILGFFNMNTDIPDKKWRGGELLICKNNQKLLILNWIFSRPLLWILIQCRL